MMLRTLFLLLFLGGSLSLSAESADSALAQRSLVSARTAFLSHMILSRQPVVPDTALPSEVPFWPDVKFYLRQAEDFGQPVRLLNGLVALHEGSLSEAQEPLAEVWSQKNWQSFGELTAAQAYLTSLSWLRQDVRLQSAWKLWPDKYLSPPSLLLGIQSYERTQPQIAKDLLAQAFALYPEDRRFFGEMTLFSADFPQVQPLWKTAVQQNLRWSKAALKDLVQRLAEAPSEQKKQGLEVLAKAGLGDYQTSSLAADYTAQAAVWLKEGVKIPPEGDYSWNQESTDTQMTIKFKKGQLVSWSSCTPGATFWIADFRMGSLSRVTEYRGEESWVLTYWQYPYVKALSWFSGRTTVEYTFLPFVTQATPLSLTLKKYPEALWPALLLKSWKPVDPSALIPQAARVYESNEGLLDRVLCLVNGQVWLEIADKNHDGRPDTWKYYRNGRLASVYQDFEGLSSPNLHEIYEQGKLAAVEADPHRKGRTEYVLYPQEGVALWDWQGTGTPLIRVFRWNGEAGLKATVFSRSEEPFQAMPAWETPPWY